jgi:glyoxylase-like metal-dependent hydrolase (beta-lactamase superfamily II)
MAMTSMLSTVSAACFCFSLMRLAYHIGFLQQGLFHRELALQVLVEALHVDLLHGIADRGDHQGEGRQCRDGQLELSVEVRERGIAGALQLNLGVVDRFAGHLVRYGTAHLVGLRVGRVAAEPGAAKDQQGSQEGAHAVRGFRAKIGDCGIHTSRTDLNGDDDLSPMAINITFHGAAGMVTGSKHLLEVPRSNGHTLRILLDCGMFQGEGKESDEKNRRFGFDPRSVDMVVLSHAHIDHSGLLPRLVKEGFSGPIYCTPATRDLCTIMLEDSARIQEYDYAYDVKRAKKRGRPIKEEGPLYEVADVPPTLAAFQVVDYHEVFKLAEGVTLTFTDAGHILGSACVHLAIDRPEGPLHLTFSGDVGRYVDRLLPDPEAFPQAGRHHLREHLRRPRPCHGTGETGRTAHPCAERVREEQGQAHHPRVQHR